MEKNKNTGISFFERYLTIWVLLCMGAGIAIGLWMPSVPEFWGGLSTIMYQSQLPF